MVYLGRIGSSLFAVNIVLRIDCVQNKGEVPVKKKGGGAAHEVLTALVGTFTDCD